MEKSKASRDLVLDTAFRLFKSQGFAKTTMRGIAKEAGISVGNAYYYFESKDQLVQELYMASIADQRAKVSTALQTEKGLANRLAASLNAGLDALSPYHAFGWTFISTVLPPSSASSPFSRASSEARGEAIQMFAQVIEGCKVPSYLQKQLPELLWLLYLGITLFWVYDRSEGQQRTRRLIKGVTPLATKVLGMARLPIVRPLIEEALQLKKELEA